MLAGALLTSVSLGAALTRPGFDLTRHANSQLALGDQGWIQTANFIVSGLLVTAFAAGVWRVIGSHRSGRIGAVCLGLYGLLAGVVVGLFPTDPMFGFPPGARADSPGFHSASTSAQVHAVASSTGFFAVTCACLAFARYFRSVRRSGWARWSWGAAAAVLAVAVYMSASAPSTVGTFNYAPVWIGGGVLWLYLTAVAWRLHRDVS
ncbi:DUF998 domain-containing protein [Mycobacterium sp. pV006]|uniref:DUF998 domain-containing protein n=1 Tax=Mycobacterium sp. pV006 TaxID=3238983 RepID=UPI00351B44F1